MFILQARCENLNFVVILYFYLNKKKKDRLLLHCNFKIKVSRKKESCMRLLDNYPHPGLISLLPYFSCKKLSALVYSSLVYYLRLKRILPRHHLIISRYNLGLTLFYERKKSEFFKNKFHVMMSYYHECFNFTYDSKELYKLVQ